METPSFPVAAIMSPARQISSVAQGPEVARIASTASEGGQDKAVPVDPTQLPAPIKGLGLAPLDLFQVGDNDDVPLPPEPPRDPLAFVAPLVPHEALPESEPRGVPQSEPHPALEVSEGPNPEAKAPALARAVQVLDEAPPVPTLDIRS